MKRLITYCVLLTLLVGCKDAFVDWNGVVENEIDYSGFFAKDKARVQMPKIGDVAIKTVIQLDKANLCVSFSDREKMEFYYFYLKDLPIVNGEDELSFPSKTLTVTCVKEMLIDDLGQTKQYEGRLICSGTMKYSSESTLKGNWLIKIQLDNDEKIVLNLNQLNLVGEVAVPLMPSEVN